MKYFLIAEYFWPGIGGLENSTAYLAEALQAFVPSEVLTAVPPGDFVDAAAFPVRRFPSSNGHVYDTIKAYIIQYPKRCGIGLYGFSDQWTDAQLDFLVSVRQDFGARVLVKIPTLREFQLYISDADRKARVQHTDYFICPNPAIQHGLIQAGIAPEQTIFRPNGVPVDRFVPVSASQKNALRKAFGLSSDRLILVFTGRFAERKRVGFLAQVCEAIPDVELLLVGYFDDRFDAGSTLPTPTPDNVHVVGPVYDVRPYLQASDIFVSASLAEGMPNSMLEAMACGLPALVTNIAGHQEVITPDFNGQLFAAQSPEQLAEQIRWFLDTRDSLPVMADNARQTIMERFNIRDVAATYYQLLTQKLP